VPSFQTNPVTKERFMKWLSPAAFVVCLCAQVDPAWAEIPGDVTYTPMFTRSEVPLTAPVYFNEMPGRPGTYIVLEQAGGVSVILREGDKWAKKEFIKVSVGEGSEVGMLGFAFHPDFATNRKYYLNYNAPVSLATVIEERVADATFLKDAGQAPRRILKVDQPATNHKGGTLAFGPKDGFLYIGMGDGGNFMNAPDKGTLLGKILRIDVNAPDSFSVPADNPFVGQAGVRGEIWALGVRNPWKWSLDPLTGELWAGDVGGATKEEISLISKGENMGWPYWEGTACNEAMSACGIQGYRAPVLDMERAASQVIIGGVVYRGNVSSAYYGLYFFGDINFSNVWAVRQSGGKLVEYKKMKSPPNGMSSFGTDAAGNIYLAGYYDGLIHRMNSEGFGPVATRAVPGLHRHLRGLLRVRAGQAWSMGDKAGTMRLHGLDGSLAATLRADEKGSIPPLALPAGLYQAVRVGDSPASHRPILVQ
jgi:glucose/arabinose dehydrogenase